MRFPPSLPQSPAYPSDPPPTVPRQGGRHRPAKAASIDTREPAGADKVDATTGRPVHLRTDHRDPRRSRHRHGRLPYVPETAIPPNGAAANTRPARAGSRPSGRAWTLRGWARWRRSARLGANGPTGAGRRPVCYQVAGPARRLERAAGPTAAQGPDQAPGTSARELSAWPTTASAVRGFRRAGSSVWPGRPTAPSTVSPVAAWVCGAPSRAAGARCA
jgi:hypothetical protein